MHRLEVINRIATAIRARTYLEIGVQKGDVFRMVLVTNRVGVDPDSTSAATHHMTSDAYFADLPADRTFDLIFVDGLHLAEQVQADIENAARHLSPGGVIVVHDCDPPTERAGQREMCMGVWCGDVWRGWIASRSALAGYDTFTVDMDLGLGIIVQSPAGLDRDRPPARIEPLTWAEFQADRNRYLGLVSVADAVRWIRTLAPVR